jgi:hypothetical protein
MPLKSSKHNTTNKTAMFYSNGINKLFINLKGQFDFVELLL